MKAVSRNTTLSMLDVIEPSRPRFNVINGGNQPKGRTMALIDRLAADLAAKYGPPIKAPVPGPRNPYINHYGKILDPEKSAQWQIEQQKGGAL